ncbi:acyl-CoA dehydrogenase [Marinomonas posidonica]|uniref:3-methylmercaptopropionyl-CoA dehydrogenase n=1 Tax=Marinomonas posidonica (strain CECT 7376 / NCIMB 14433 / IVIA-Po-181) TaxID=491952 RepID=F6CZZ9_MARPP|nr:acyl-CoA dehydrogenase [Marinomonas posidonica]AEF54739.1 Isovaleryl-CoA dehydrogenase [Marinomonas posidonica IVIA-Po-181]
MSEYQYPYNDILFSLLSVADIEKLTPYLDEPVDQELLEAILGEAGKLSEQVIAPINASGDSEGSRVENGEVIEAKGFKDAFKAYTEGGWVGLSGDPEYGGQGLPSFIATAVNEGVQSANLAFSLCPLLSHGAIEAISSHASEALKAEYLPKMLSGEWAGTMNLTEPSAGSDLAAIACKAEVDGDAFRVKGQKIFITWGDHQMSDNIIHLVLARLPNAPSGVKGISLFLVPKFLLDDAGNPSQRNDVQVVSVEHKLGIHASPTCVMSFGEQEGALGYLVGEENQGIKAMFTMMNNARQGVGLQGLAIAERAYQQALSYAKDRKQGMKADRSGKAAIIEHPDVLRMLMTMKSQIDAMRSLVYVAAIENDLSHLADGEVKQKAVARTALYTPIVKGWITEQAQEITSLALQVHGGMGFIEETGVAQHARDARILPIYEGTNGIQAIDLIGRKLYSDKGVAMTALLEEISADIKLWSSSGLADQLRKIEAALEQAQKATQTCLQSMEKNSTLGTASAYSYMMLMGYVIGAWLQVKALYSSQRHDGFDQSQKQSWAHSVSFYCDQILPRATSYFQAIESGRDSVESLTESSFIR